MKKETKRFLTLTCGCIISITIIVFFFTLWLYCYNNINDALKESWTIAFSCLSALATIGAAVIASYLFNDWKEQHNKNSLKELAMEIHNTYNTLNVKLISINDIIVKSSKKNKFNNIYNSQLIADEIEQDIKEIGDYLATFLHQISFLDELKSNDNEFMDNVHNTIIDYMKIMDISYYRNINNHLKFLDMEAEVKLKFDELRTPLIKYLKDFILTDSN